jgi:ABC-type multidrug transport system fused ATPase/permease subunit
MFFDEGRLAAEGTHEELMGSCPEYAAMRRLQGGARWSPDS